MNRRIASLAWLWVASLCLGQVVLPDADGDGHPLFSETAQRPEFDFFGDHEPRGGYATCVAFGDLDGDGDLDAVCTLNDALPNSVSYITVMFNAGDGVLGPPTAYLAGSGSCAVDLADVDGDGDVDAAIANFIDDTIGVLRNDGAGVLGGLVKYRVGSDPRSVKLADVNHDGARDLVALNVGSKDVSVLLNDGAGGFVWPGARIAVSGVTGHNGHSGPHLDVADFNGDGAIDIAAPAGSSIKLLMNQGDGSFELAAAHPRLAAPSAYHVLARDLDGDGDADLACAVSEGSGADHALQVFKNDGAAGFGPPDVYTIDPWEEGCEGCWFDTTSAAAGDFDGDGDADLIVGQNSFEFTTIFRNAGDGTFTRETVKVDSGTWFVAVADLNGGPDDALQIQGRDGLLRIMIDPSDVSRPLLLPGISSGLTSVRTCDLDGDDDEDLVVGMLANDPGQLRVFLNRGSRSFVPLDGISLGRYTESSVVSLDIGDTSGDGVPDIVAADVIDQTSYTKPGKVWTLRGRGDGTFDERAFISIGQMTPHWITLVDIDMDHDLDALVWACGSYPGGWVTPVEKYVLVLRNTDGVLVEEQRIVIGVSPWFPAGSVEVLDIERDGDLDAVATFNSREGNGGLVLLENHGTGILTQRSMIPAQPMQAVPLDVDRDGFTDILVSRGGSDVERQPYAEWYRNDGSGFGRAGEWRDDAGVRASMSVASGLNPSGQDSALFVYFFVTIMDHLDSPYSTRADYALPFQAWGSDGPKLACADFDLDGRLDVACTQSSEPAPVILWNVGAFPCPADLNHDRRLDVFDFLAFQRAFGDEESAADLADPRGVFDLADYAAFRDAFAAGCR